jgi:prepilin-type N-terminal cleavage/methylation domain-containing protein
MLRAAGFTLIELIGVIVIASIGMVGVAKMFGNTNLALSRATTEQVMSQYLQECAERVLETRRDYGFASTLLTTTVCDPSPLSYTRTVSLPSTYTGTTTTACPNGIVCRDVTVKVCTGSISPCPTTASSATATLMLVTY